MGIKYVLDTHALLWYLQGDKRLGAEARQALQNPASELILPATAYGEVCWIVEHGRTNIPNASALKAAIDADLRVFIYPLDQEVVDRSQTLSAIHEMHDRQIVATALVLTERGEEVALLTQDGNIMASGLVGMLW